MLLIMIYLELFGEYIMRRIKPFLIFVSGAVLGWLLTYAWFALPSGGGGISGSSPDKKHTLLVLGTGYGLRPAHKGEIVSFFFENPGEQDFDLDDALISYRHHTSGLHLRGHENKVEWSPDSKTVKANYQDIINGKTVNMSFEYDLISDSWILKKTSIPESNLPPLMPLRK